MLQLEKLIKQFSWGISVLTAYLHYNNKINFSDINIVSEVFAQELLNIFFDLQLTKPKHQNSPGYDLISKHDKVIVQISTTCTSEKVKHTFSILKKTISQNMHRKMELQKELVDIERTLVSYENVHEPTKGEQLSQKEKERLIEKSYLERERKQLYQEISDIIDIRGYRILFFFLCEDVDKLIKYKAKKGFLMDVPSELTFCQTEDILCFTSLIRAVQYLSQYPDANKIGRLEKFMKKNSNVFMPREAHLFPKNKVDQVINEYATNFTSPLFLHQFSQDTHVTLQNLFVEPSFSPVNLTAHEVNPNNMIALIDSFIWDCNKDRLLFLDGDAAIGKTSLISWLCYHYLELDDIGKAIFLNIKLVCIRLRDLSLTKDCSAEKCVLQYLSFEDMDAFEQQYKNALIVLEGADELGIVSGMESVAIEQFILNIRHAFFSHKIVITSRPKFIAMSLFSGSSQTFSYQHYSLDHFSSEKRASWLYNYEAKEKCGQIVPTSTKQYLSELSDEDATGVADTPLALYLLVACEITDTLRDNKWALYHEIFHKAIRDTPYNEAFRGSKTTLHKALQEDSFAEAVYKTVGEIANKMFVNLKEDRFFIYSNELDAIIANTHTTNNSERAKAVRKCCVLCAYWKENANTGALEFYHNNIRAFFMCEYIYQRFSNIPLFPATQESIQQFIEIACEVFQYGIIARSTWAQTFSFLYYRLQYEKNSCPGNICISSEQEVESLFSTIIYTMINSGTMWKYSFRGLPYESIKASFLNTSLFLRIWLSPYTSISLSTFSNSDHYSFWHKNDLFKDWIKIFSDAIEVSKHKHIAFGSHMEYKAVVFEHTNLADACFEESVFVESTFKEADLRGANFSGAHLKNVIFSGANLSDTNFSGATLINVDFSCTSFFRTNFQDATIINAIWPQKSSCFDSAVFTNAEIIDASWKNLKLKNANFSGAVFKTCVFRNIQFLNPLEKTVFYDCSIAKTTFTSIYRLQFSGEKSSLSSLHFCGAVKNCLFYGGILSDSDWTGTSLNDVVFTNAQICNPIFRASKIQKVTFDGCSFDGNIDVYKAHISKSAYDVLKAQTAKILNLSSVEIDTER